MPFGHSHKKRAHIGALVNLKRHAQQRQRRAVAAAASDAQGSAQALGVSVSVSNEWMDASVPEEDGWMSEEAALSFDGFVQQESIFVSIPSYRETETAKTINDIFLKAQYPSRIFVGVLQQNLPGDTDALQGIDPAVAEYVETNVRIKRISANDATGPSLARSIIERELYNGETFYLGIDAHMLFVPSFDVLLIEELLKCPSEKAVLTCYPPNFNKGQRTLPKNLPLPYILKFKGFHPEMHLVEIGHEQCKHRPSTPTRSLFWAAGFSFTWAKLIEDVPYDPNVPYLFLGEEISRTVRMFTHGWNLYSPTQTVAFHMHAREGRHGTFWELFFNKGGIAPEAVRQQRKQLEQQSIKRIQTLLTTGVIPESEYGLGTERSIAEFQDFAGVDLVRKRIRSHAKVGLCKEPTADETYAITGVASAPVAPVAPVPGPAPVAPARRGISFQQSITGRSEPKPMNAAATRQSEDANFQRLAAMRGMRVGSSR